MFEKFYSQIFYIKCIRCMKPCIHTLPRIAFLWYNLPAESWQCVGSDLFLVTLTLWTWVDHMAGVWRMVQYQLRHVKSQYEHSEPWRLFAEHMWWGADSKVAPWSPLPSACAFVKSPPREYGWGLGLASSHRMCTRWWSLLLWLHHVRLLSLPC